jgi:hypothetical protein
MLAIDFFKDFIKNKVSYELEIVSTVYNATEDETTLVVTDAMYSRKKLSIFIDEVEKVIKSVAGNTIIITGDVSSGARYRLLTPYFNYGYVIGVNAEMVEELDTNKITPFIYMPEGIKERTPIAKDSTVSKTYPTLRFYFLDQSNFDEFTVEEYYTKVISRMYKLSEHFVNTIIDSKLLKLNSDYDIDNVVKFGVVADMRGTTSKIFDNDFSGVLLTIDTSIFKSLLCVK